MSSVARRITAARRVIVCVACGAALGLPAGALGQTSIAPPGNSGVDQYFETVPGAGGNQAAQRRPRPGGAGAVDAQTLQRLRRLGADGRQAAALIAGTAPLARAHTPGTTPESGVTSGSSPVVAGVGAVARAGSDGLGILLPLLLGAVLVAALIAALVRRRRSRR